MSFLRAALLVLTLFGCGMAPRRIDEVVVCDRSTSASCDEGAVRALATEFLSSSPPPDSTFEVLATGCGVQDVDLVFRIEIPSRWGAGVARKRRAFADAERARLDALMLPGLRRRCSAIAAAVWKAGRLLAERSSGDKRLTVVSDMREASRDLGVNFESRLPAPKDFVARLRAHDLLADLSQVRVVAFGVHDRATPDSPKWTATQSRRLAEVWDVAFAAMGANHVRLREEYAGAFDGTGGGDHKNGGTP